MATATAPSPGRNGTSQAVGNSIAHPAMRGGATAEVPLLVGREEGEFIVYDDVPVWTEHYSRHIGERFTREDLERIAARCNERLEDTGDPAMLVIRHTSDDPGAAPPPVVGFGGPFRVGTYGKKNPKAAIFATFRCFKEHRDVVRQHPRVSVEYAYSKNDPKGGYFDVISLLGAETPELDLGVRYAKRFAADPDLCIGRYSRTVQFAEAEDLEANGNPGDDQGDDASDDSVAHYSADSAPGGSNTYVPGTGGGKSGKSSNPKKNSQGGSPNGSGKSSDGLQHAQHGKVNSGDGSKSTTNSTTGTADNPGGAASANNPAHGQRQGEGFRATNTSANYADANGANGGQAGANAQRSSLSQVDIAQIVAAIQPSIEECVRRIIPAPQPPPVENTIDYGQIDQDGDGDADFDADPDDDGDFDSLGGAADSDADGDLDDDSDDSSDSDAESQGDSPLAGSAPKNAGGKDGGRDASASASQKPPAGKSKKTPKKERFSMALNNKTIDGKAKYSAALSAKFDELSKETPETLKYGSSLTARYHRWRDEALAELDRLGTERDTAVSERDDLRSKYRETLQDATTKGDRIVDLESRIGAIEADARQKNRYSKLLTLQNEGYTFSLDDEMKDCQEMSDDAFTRHESRIRANYQRVPLNMVPVDRVQVQQPNAKEATLEERARYVQHAQREAGKIVMQAKQAGERITMDQAYTRALREAYEKDGKNLPAAMVA